VIIYLAFSIVVTAWAYGKGEKQTAAGIYYSEALARIASFLVPGGYRLLVELRDNTTGDRTQCSLEFEIASPRK
jgi:hypothetical protein